MQFYKKKFREIRGAKRWTIKAFAKAGGFARCTVVAWENGTRSPSDKNIRIVAKILKVPLSEISNLKDDAASEYRNYSSGIIEMEDEEFQKTIVEFEKINRSINILQKKYKHIKTLLNGLLSASNSIIYMKDIESKYIIANKYFINILGLEPDYNVYKKTDFDFFNRLEAKKNFDEDNLVIHSNKPLINKEGYIPGSKKKLWGLYSKTPVLESNKVVALIGIWVNITEAKRQKYIHDLIIKSINRLNVVLSIFDTKRKMQVFKNESAEIFFGINRISNNETVDCWLEKVVHPDDLKKQIEYVNNNFNNNNFLPARKYRIIHPEHGIRWIKVIAANDIEFMKGIYSVALSVDVTEEMDVTIERKT